MVRFRWYFRFFRHVIFLPLYLLVPKDRRTIIFGAWFGRQVAGSPKYLLKYLLEKRIYKCFWVGDEIVRDVVHRQFPSVGFLKMGTWQTWWRCLRAGVFVYNIDLQSDIIKWFPHCQRVLLINTTHGGVNKKCGVSMLQGDGTLLEKKRPSNKVRYLFHMMLENLFGFMYGEKCWGSTSSIQQRDLIFGTYPGRYSEKSLLTEGMPCVDFLVKNKGNFKAQEEIKCKYAKLLGIPKDKKWYLYAPTWRHADGVPFSIATSKYLSAYNSILASQDAILIDKEHPKTLERNHLHGGVSGNICVVSQDQAVEIDVQELLLVCDRLISDYSTIYMDYGVLHRPVIEFTFDYDFVANMDFGLEYDLREYAPGPFAYNEEELQNLLMKTDEELLAFRTKKFESQIKCEQGHACEALERLVFERGF